MKAKFLLAGLTAVVLSASLVACGGKGDEKKADGAAKTSGLSGAGSTFIAPLFQKWSSEYNKTSGVAINYQSVGSGAGVDQIKKKTVDFGASDEPMKPEQLAENKMVQFPTAVGGVVPVYHIEGIAKGVVFSGPVLGDIYLGKIKKWNDPALVKLNPSVKLPDAEIKVVRRSDGSGTTYLWTEYLSKVNEGWAGKAHKSPNWIEGTVGGKGNEGVAANVKQFANSIGYVEYIYAKKNDMTYGSIVNKAGKVVAPSDESFTEAAATADWTVPGMAASLTNAPGEKAWPIAGTAFVIMHLQPENSQNSAQILKFFDWALTSGQPMAKELNYIPLPESVVAIIKGKMKEIKDASGQSIL